MITLQRKELLTFVDWHRNIHYHLSVSPKRRDVNNGQIFKQYSSIAPEDWKAAKDG
ncbi:hypothetical protein I79_005372 [Cricetulus griseus]|uniref:Uncharacterized protein n=1 Tax=Cricetulus griseus TaxID=10029 RepID=G3H507_CRIGR|nr:hypothetical protein I79_005372 [Cricetulus griseus]